MGLLGSMRALDKLEQIIGTDASSDLLRNKKILYGALIAGRRSGESQCCKTLGLERVKVRTMIWKHYFVTSTLL